MNIMTNVGAPGAPFELRDLIRRVGEAPNGPQRYNGITLLWGILLDVADALVLPDLKSIAAYLRLTRKEYSGLAIASDADLCTRRVPPLVEMFLVAQQMVEKKVGLGNAWMAMLAGRIGQPDLDGKALRDALKALLTHKKNQLDESRRVALASERPGAASQRKLKPWESLRLEQQEKGASSKTAGDPVPHVQEPAVDIGACRYDPVKEPFLWLLHQAKDRRSVFEAWACSQCAKTVWKKLAPKPEHAWNDGHLRNLLNGPMQAGPQTAVEKFIAYLGARGLLVPGDPPVEDTQAPTLPIAIVAEPEPSHTDVVCEALPGPVVPPLPEEPVPEPVPVVRALRGTVAAALAKPPAWMAVTARVGLDPAMGAWMEGFLAEMRERIRRESPPPPPKLEEWYLLGPAHAAPLARMPCWPTTPAVVLELAASAHAWMADFLAEMRERIRWETLAEMAPPAVPMVDPARLPELRNQLNRWKPDTANLVRGMRVVGMREDLVRDREHLNRMFYGLEPMPEAVFELVFRLSQKAKPARQSKRR